jgi:hypothetical protein
MRPIIISKLSFIPTGDNVEGWAKKSLVASRSHLEVAALGFLSVFP